MALLEIKDIHKSFGNLNVLNGIDLTVNKGDVIAILGLQDRVRQLCFAALII